MKLSKCDKCKNIIKTTRFHWRYITERKSHSGWPLSNSGNYDLCLNCIKKIIKYIK